MTTADHFQVVLPGIIPPHDVGARATKLSSRFDVSAEQMKAILAIPNHVAARGLAREAAEQYAEAFREHGIEARVEPEVTRLAIALPTPSLSAAAVNESDDTIRRIADYQRISGVLWIILGIVQILSVYGIIAGLWNIPGGISRLRQATRIRARDSTIPAAFEPVVGLVVIGVINLVAGGVIGVAVVGFDFWIRDRVLKHRGIFTESVPVLDAYARKKLRREARQAKRAALLTAANRDSAGS